MLKRIFIILILIWNGIIFSQEIVLFGTQKAQKGQNAKLECKEIILTQTYIITKIETNTDGFWIQNDTKVIYDFSKKNGNFYPSPEGIELKPGKYKVFPNLKDGQDSAFVKIILREKI